MPTLIDEAASPHLADFIDTVGELVAAVLDMDLGVAHRQVAAVDVGYSRHWAIRGIGGQSIPNALSFRCSAERSMPTNSAVREMLPPNRLIWARRYSRSNASRASRSGIPISVSPPFPAGMLGTIEPTSCGSMLAEMTASGSPPARIISRSTLLRSWR